QPLQFELFVPDRFDVLQRRATDSLKNIIVRVDEATDEINDRWQDMRAAGRGSLVVMRGESGSGKSTFLHTLHLFLEGVEALSIPQNTPIPTALDQCESTTEDLRIIEVEHREAMKD